MDRQLDDALIMDVEMLGAEDIHSAKAAICKYCVYARWLTKPPPNCPIEEAESNFDKWERILRAFVAYRRSGDLRSIKQIEDELCSDSR